MAVAVAAIGNVAAVSPAAAGAHLPFLVAAAGPVLVPQIAAWLEDLAVRDLPAFERVAAGAFAERARAEAEPPAAEALLTGQGMWQLEDGSFGAGVLPAAGR